jgi:hypothetical protein
MFGGLAAAGLAYWWYSSHLQASAQIVSQPAVPPGALPNVSAPVVGVSAVLPVGTMATPSGQDQTELDALMSWAQTTQNPALYQQMIQGLSPTDLDSLYNILTTDWEGSGKPTTTQTAFWNGLVGRYPFLKNGGAGCNNFACN